ncbi:MAG: NAD(+) synthase [Chloroflexia bacterium]|nr:NAD(+) synthase [Chloroflexia bacterium]
MHTSYQPTTAYLRVATACPIVHVADVASNCHEIMQLYDVAVVAGVALVVFPELAITGYSLGDLVQHDALLTHAMHGLVRLAQHTTAHTAMIVGLPLTVGNALYNCAAILADGHICGIVPKQFLPNYGEFYEKRWYQPWHHANTTVQIGDDSVPFGTQLLFRVAETLVGIEICEDLWVNQSPSRMLVDHGAMIIANPSASPELVAKASYRRNLVSMQSATLVCGYVYAGCDWTESSMDVVMSGHQLICSNGRIQAERLPFARDQRLTISDIDSEHLQFDRRRDSNRANHIGYSVVATTVTAPNFTPQPVVNAYPFLPSDEDPTARAARLQHILAIQAHGLAQRMRATRAPYLHLGLSGGLDSTLAFLVACQAATILGRAPADVLRTYTMPAAASSDRTQSNAVTLASLYGIPNQVIAIGDLVVGQLHALGHDGISQDITYENVQARLRTSILFNKANQLGGFVLGTGDLSEIALGWCTFNGDHMSHYHVNAGVPKTLVRHLVQQVADTQPNPDVTAVLVDILATPVSPELTTTSVGEVSQKTEDIIGPYELHDFFLYHLVRWGDRPAKIALLAQQAFGDAYTSAVIDKWLTIFIKRFAGSQFKRSVMPDGPKVGSVALSPRGDWRMPSDLLNAAVWNDA